MSKSFNLGNIYVGFIYGKNWRKEDLKLFEASRTHIGFTLQIWRVGMYYDNWNKIEEFRK